MNLCRYFFQNVQLFDNCDSLNDIYSYFCVFSPVQCLCVHFRTYNSLIARQRVVTVYEIRGEVTTDILVV